MIRTIAFAILLLGVTSSLTAQKSTTYRHRSLSKRIHEWRKEIFTTVGPGIAYEASFAPYWSKLYLGASTVFVNHEGDKALSIDNFAVLIVNEHKWYFNNTLSYRFRSGWNASYSSDVYAHNGKLGYMPGLGLNVDIGLFGAGIYCYYKPLDTGRPLLGIRLIMRPFDVFELARNN